MSEDQSVVGRRRIYYDPEGGEALICSDSEEETVEEEDEKKEFVESEDYILRLEYLCVCVYLIIHIMCCFQLFVHYSEESPETYFIVFIIYPDANLCNKMLSDNFSFNSYIG